jgi:hypothetical protein
MRTHEHLVRCGGLGRSAHASLGLDLHGPDKNVTLKIEDIDKRLGANIPDELLDLLNIAAYVYAADSAIGRGGKTDSGLGARWRRRFRFAVPVRRPELWASAGVAQALVDTLSFLSEDDFAFEFERLDRSYPAATYLDLAPPADFVPDEVILFSGGLDSLSGAIEALAARTRRVALVSHRAVATVATPQRALVSDLRKRFGPKRVMHIPVWMNLTDGVGRESTHRTRSFLFAALATVTARLCGLDRFSFYENGTVSLNLPPVAQVVGSRATRSTHPQAVAGFRRLLSAVVGAPFDVDNPFAWLTKTQIVERIAENGAADLIRHSRSCTRVRGRTIQYPHCGQCSQCIDRRFAVLAAGQADADPAESYEVDLFAGARPEGPDREMALAYVRSSTMINRMDELAFFTRYGEISRIVGQFDEPADVVAGRILKLYRSHASAVCDVFDAAVGSHASQLREGSLPADCLLKLVVAERSESPTYAVAEGPQDPHPAPATEIRMAVDKAHTRVHVVGWGMLKGKDAELIIKLSEPFIRSRDVQLLPQNFAFTLGSDLEEPLGYDNNEAFRRCVDRCRRRLAKLASAAGAAPLTSDTVIESIPRRGYRLNPDHVRLVALSEIEQGQTGDATPAPRRSVRKPRAPKLHMDLIDP